MIKPENLREVYSGEAMNIPILVSSMIGYGKAIKPADMIAIYVEVINPEQSKTTPKPENLKEVYFGKANRIPRIVSFMIGYGGWIGFEDTVKIYVEVVKVEGRKTR